MGAPYNYKNFCTGPVRKSRTEVSFFLGYVLVLVRFVGEVSGVGRLVKSCRGHAREARFFEKKA